MKRISFDFDQTLSNKSVQDFTEMILVGNYELFVITKRFHYPQKHISNANNDIRLVCAKLRIPWENVIFTNNISKASFIVDNKIDVHLENDLMQVNELAVKEVAEIVYVHPSNKWQQKLFKTLIKISI